METESLRLWRNGRRRIEFQKNGKWMKDEAAIWKRLKWRAKAAMQKSYWGRMDRMDIQPGGIVCVTDIQPGGGEQDVTTTPRTGCPTWRCGLWLWFGYENNSSNLHHWKTGKVLLRHEVRTGPSPPIYSNLPWFLINQPKLNSAPIQSPLSPKTNGMPQHCIGTPVHGGRDSILKTICHCDLLAEL